MSVSRVRVVDSHTAGEPTRVVIEGGPNLGDGPLAQRLERFRHNHDPFRSSVVNEPRGSDVLVGALHCKPDDSSCAAGVIFFNNVGYLNMCGHGLIGYMATLSHLGFLGLGTHRIETPVGVVTATLHSNGEVSFENVPSYRQSHSVEVQLPGIGAVRGDVAWGGNWFYLVEEHGKSLSLSQVEDLTDYAWKVRCAVNEQGFPAVDHIELVGPPQTKGAHSRNFVLCPGRAYDRSPCGTGTSAKIACLAAAGELAEGEDWVQESILGTTFVGRYRRGDDPQTIVPRITSTAYINSEATLLLDERDPFCWGIRS